jgi:phage-related minor tail protein
MSGPTLGLGITATGVEQMRLLADSVERLDSSLASLERRQGGGSGAQLGGLAALQAEVVKIRQGLGEATAGLRTELADLKTSVTKSMQEAYGNLAKTARTGGKQVSDEVKKAAEEAEKAAERYRAAVKQVAVAMNNATGEFTKFNPATGLRGSLVDPLEAALAGIDKTKAQHMVASAKLDQQRLEQQQAQFNAERTMMDTAVAQYRTIQARQLADQLAFESKQREQFATYLAEREARLAEERAMMDMAVAQFNAIKAKQLTDQIAFEERQKILWVEHNVNLAERLRKEATMMDAAVAQFRIIQAKQLADQIAFESEQKLLWQQHTAANADRMVAERTMMDSAAAQFRAIRAADLADQIAFEGKQKALWIAEVAALKEREAAYLAMTPRGQLSQQLKARAALDVGFDAGSVVSKFGSTATAAAQASSIAALRAEMDKLVPSSAHAAVGAKTLSEAVKGIAINSGVAREGLALVDEGLQNRFKNMAGTLVVLLNRMGLAPFIFQATTLAVLAAVAAVGALAVAFAKGNRELSDFNAQMIMTGGAIGLTASGFTQARDAMEGIGVTKGKAAEALTAVAAAGLAADKNSTMFAKTAIMLEMAVDQPLKDTVKHFADLAHAPAEASATLNEKLNYLTASVYAQIKALEEHGKTQEAANLAEKTYADAMQERAQHVLDGQGSIQRGWRAVGDVAKWAWDQMLNIGREDSLADKLKEAADNLDRTRDRFGGAQPKSGFSVSAADRQKVIDAAQTNYQDAFRRSEIESGKPISDQERIEAARARIEFDKFNYKSADQTRIEKRDLEIERIRTTGRIANASQAEIDARVAAVMERQTPKGRGGSANLATTLEGKGKIADAQSALYQQLMDTNNTTPIDKLTEAEKQLLMIEAKLRDAKDATTIANLHSAEVVAKETVEKEKQADLSRVQHTLWMKDLKVIDDVTKANDSSADSIEAKAKQIEEENKHWGKNKTAVEEANLAEMKLQEFEAGESDTFNPQYVASIRKKTQAQEDYVKQLQLAEVHTEQKKLTEELRVQQESAKTLDLEYSLVGKTANERDRILAARQAEVKLAKDLAAIDNINATTPEALAGKEQARSDAINKARLESDNNARKVTLEQWQKTSDEIEKGLTDALMNGFNSGKNFAKSLRDYLKQLFDNLVLRPIIQAVVAPLAGQLGGYATTFSQMLSGGSATGPIGGSTPGGLGTTVMNNTGLIGAGYQYLTGSMTGASSASLGAANAVGMMNGGGVASDSLSTLIAGNGGWAGVNAGLGASSVGALGGATSGMSLGAIGEGTATFGALDTGAAALSAGSLGVGAAGGLGAGATTFGVLDTGAAMASLGGGAVAGGATAAGGMGLAGAAAAIPVVGWVIAAAAILYSMFGQPGGGPKQDGRFGLLGSGVAKYDKDLTPQNNEVAQTAATGLQKQFDSLVKTLGGTSDIKYGLGFSLDPKGKSPTFLDITGSRNGQVVTNDVNLKVGRSQDDLQKAIAEYSSRAILKGLQQSNLGGKIGAYFATLNVNAMSSADVATTMTRVQKLTTERASLQDRLFNMTATSLQKLNKQRDAEREAIDETNKELLEQVYAQEDLVQAGNDLLTAYNNQVTQVNALRAYAANLKQWLSDALLGENSPLSVIEQLAQAAEQFNSTLAAAHGGDATAQSNLPNVANTYLQSLKANSASRVDYAMGFSQVAGSLTTESASADSQATLLEQQLDTAKASLTALNLINDNVKTFAQAWAAFNTAQANLDAAKAAVTAADAMPVAPAVDSSTTTTNAPESFMTQYGLVTPTGGGVNGGSVNPYDYGGGGDGGPGFAVGGYHRGGVRVVGENGPELEVTGQSYIHDAAATRRLMAQQSDGDGGDAVAELRDLRREMRANVAYTMQLAKDFRELKNRGFPVTNTGDGTVALNTHAV